MSRDHDDIGAEELAQKGCALEGVTQLLSQTPGSFRVVLHADADCANLIPRASRAVDPSRFYCTNLGEQELILGSARGRLEEVVLAVDRSGPVTAIFLVGSCVSSLIGDDVRALAKRLGPKTRAALIPIDTQAFKLSGQAEIIELLTRHLGELAPPPGEAEGVVNLLGYPADDDGELAAVLAELGAPVNARLSLESPLERWGALRQGRLNVAADRRLFRSLLQTEQRDRHTPWLEAAPPYGVTASVAFYEAVALALARAEVPDPQRRLAEVMATHRGDLSARVGRLRKRWQGHRLLYHLGARKDFALTTVVQEGFAPLRVFEELGFAVELAFQGAPEPAARGRVRAALERRGIGHPFHMVPDRVSLSRLLGDGGYRAVCCSDSLHEEVARAGVTQLPLASLRSGLRGARWCLDWLEGALAPR